MLAVASATIGAWAAVATAVIYVLIATFAVRQVREARELREQQSRPFVVAEFVPGFVIAFRVRNLGATLARNVRLTIDQWPVVTRSLKSDPVWTDPSASRLFGQGISYLPPQQEISTLFDIFHQRVEADLPMQYTVTVQYDSFDLCQCYNETYDLDLDLVRELTRINRKELHDLAVSVEKIQKAIERGSK